jgi:hypothetical protein
VTTTTNPALDAGSRPQSEGRLKSRRRQRLAAFFLSANRHPASALRHYPPAAQRGEDRRDRRIRRRPHLRGPAHARGGNSRLTLSADLQGGPRNHVQVLGLFRGGVIADNGIGNMADRHACHSEMVSSEEADTGQLLMLAAAWLDLANRIRRLASVDLRRDRDRPMLRATSADSPQSHAPR